MASPCAEEPAHNRLAEVTASGEAKAGVNSLLDEVSVPQPVTPQHVPPIIDLSDAAEGERRREAVEQIRHATESWGFFQLVGHGVPAGILDEMLAATRRFHEGDAEEKDTFCTREREGNWRDSLFFAMAPDPPRPEALPPTCREIILEYSKRMARVGETLLELLSEALGLRPSHLKELDCARAFFLVVLHYPARPEVELTVGCVSHRDASFISLLQQDDVGGLQVLHQDQWVDVPPVPGALAVLMGDFMQLITNDRFKAVVHRVVSNRECSRVSVGCFFTSVASQLASARLYGPMKELLSEDDPPKYREFPLSEYSRHYNASLSSGEWLLSRYKL